MSNRNNQINVPQAKQAMEQSKIQATQEVRVNLQQGYYGHLTSRELVPWAARRLIRRVPQELQTMPTKS